MKVVSLDEETNARIVLFLLKNVKDIKTLKKKIVTGEIDCCAVKPALIVNFFQIVIAANKAVRSKKEGRLKTKSLNTELLYNLSLSKNITQSLSKFGIDDKDKHIAVVIFEENEENKFEQIKCHFKGEICGIEEITEQSDVNLIKKTYNITDKELQVSQLIDSIVSRISTKDFGSY